MTKVNLDALIPREDFAMGDSKRPQSLADRLKISELVKGEGFFYSSLRKPDFQRETSDWDREKIASFIKSFLDGDLIPSIILWQAGQFTFVIDGAHRLSALIAWANDDYGDGLISQAFFAHDVDPEQKRVSEQTKKFVNSAVGSYSDYKKWPRLSEQQTPIYKWKPGDFTKVQSCPRRRRLRRTDAVGNSGRTTELVFYAAFASVGMSKP